LRIQLKNLWTIEHDIKFDDAASARQAAGGDHNRRERLFLLKASRGRRFQGNYKTSF
jgi:hypothetical protein